MKKLVLFIHIQIEYKASKNNSSMSMSTVNSGNYITKHTEKNKDKSRYLFSFSDWTMHLNRESESLIQTLHHCI